MYSFNVFAPPTIGAIQYNGKAFKISMTSRWMIVVTGPDMIEDIRKADDDKMSFRDANADVLLLSLLLTPFKIGY
jgi:hypothetical protein